MVHPPASAALFFLSLEMAWSYSRGVGCQFSGAISSRRGTMPSGLACGVSLAIASSHWAGPTKTGGGALKLTPCFAKLSLGRGFVEASCCPRRKAICGLWQAVDWHPVHIWVSPFQQLGEGGLSTLPGRLVADTFVSFVTLSLAFSSPGDARELAWAEQKPNQKL